MGTRQACFWRCAWLANLVVSILIAEVSYASDWPRFRGPNGSGVSADTAPLPTSWSPSRNLKWKVKLPGPGSSSPIVVGQKIFVTCWTGYGVDKAERGGDQKNLKRHLICLDRATGDLIWDKAVEAALPEDNYHGMITEHGYATHTPVSDGERVYVFFGKTGALAFDMAGNQLWRTQLGTGSDRMGRGSGSSPILLDNLLIVTAAAESESIYALDKITGKQVWRSEAEGYQATWGTPVLVNVDADRTDIVIAVPYEIWALDPTSGKLSWFCESLNARSFCSSLVADGKVVYAIGEQGSGSIAVSAGGKSDVTASNVLWKGRDSNRISTPVIADGKLYSINNGVITCNEAKTNHRLYQARLAAGGPAVESADEPPARPPRGGGPGGPGGPGGGRGGGRGGMGGQDYASPVVGDGKLYFVTRSGECHVVQLGDKFEKLSSNRVTDDTEEFNATPAISDGAIFIRSTANLYCVAEEGKVTDK